MDSDKDLPEVKKSGSKKKKLLALILGFAVGVVWERRRKKNKPIWKQRPIEEIYSFDYIEDNHEEEYYH